MKTYRLTDGSELAAQQIAELIGGASEHER